MSEKRTIPVEVVASMHKRPPQDEYERLSWAALDTAWNLLRETAIRLVLADVREQIAAHGGTFPSDEELFAREADNPDFPHSYLDMAPSPEDAGRALDTAFRILLVTSFDNAVAAVESGRA